jgi:hypothetical protein
MELNKIERLVEKYFDGETSVEEEKELRKYFASTDVASHLMQYKSILVFILCGCAGVPTRTSALPKLQYKNVLSYGYQLLLQFLCS